MEFIKVECRDFFHSHCEGPSSLFSNINFYYRFVLQAVNGQEEEPVVKIVVNGPEEEEHLVESHVGWEELGRNGMGGVGNLPCK